jgi:hypothetical protein
LQRPPWIEFVLAGVMLAVLACLVLARCLPSGMAPVSVDPLYSAPDAVPFAEVRPADFRATHPYVSDTTMVFEPWLEFMAREIAAGELPLWSPLSGGGLPMMGNLSSAVFFPFTWFSFVPSIGVARGMFFAALCKLIVAGVCGYLLLRRLGGSRIAAAAGGIGFMLFGYQVVWLNYSLTNVSCLLPLVLWAADRFAERSSAGRGFTLSCVLALQFLGGHAETSLALGIAVVLWLATHGGVAALLRLVPWGMISLALCAFQLAPFLEYLAESQGRAERLASLPPAPEPFVTPLSIFGLLVAAMALFRLVITARDFRAVGPITKRVVWRMTLAGVSLWFAGLCWSALGMRPLAALLIDPGAFGDPTRGGAYIGPEAFPDVNGGYVGSALLALSVLYGLVAEDRRRVRFLFWSAVIGAGFAFAIEPLHSLLRRIPPFDLAAGTRMLPLFASGVIVAGALALDEVLRSPERFRAVAGRVGIAAVVAVLSALVLPSVDQFVSRRAAVPAAPDVVLTIPAQGAEFRPSADGRGASQLRIDLAGRVVAAPFPDSVRLRIGSGVIDAKCAADGSFATTWNATRAEAGRYRIVAHAGENRVSAEREIVLVRSATFERASWLRVALVLGLLALIARVPALRWLVIVVIAMELHRFAEPYNPATPVEQVFPHTGVTDFLAAEEAAWRARGDGPFRVLCEDVILQPNMNHAYGLQVVRAYDQLEFRPFRALLLEWVGDVPFVRYNRDTIALTHPLCDVLNVAYVVTSAPLERPGYELVFTAQDGKSGRIYRNRNALRRAFVVDSAVDRRTLSREQLVAFDPRKTGFLETTAPALEPSNATLRFVDYRSSRVEIDVTSNRDTMLVLSDNDFPGWRCFIGERESPILRTHLALRAVAVPAGSSRVRFEYAPRSFTLGLWLAAAAAAIGTAVVVASRWRKSSVGAAAGL